MLLYDKVPDLWNRGTPLLRRLLWANLALLPPYIFEKILEMYLEDDFLLGSTHSYLKKIYELCRFAKCEERYIEIIVKLLKNTNYNNFHYEVIKFSEEINNKDIKYCALDNIKRIDKMLLNISNLAKI